MKFLPRLKKLNSHGVSHIVVPLLVVVAVGVAGTYMLVGSHAATPNRKGYLVVFSGGGEFDQFKVRLVGAAAKGYQCGSSFGSNSYTKDIALPAGNPKVKGFFAPKIVSCTQVSGGASYEVFYAKMDQLHNQVYSPLPTAVDIDAGWCTFVHPSVDGVTPGVTKKVQYSNGHKCSSDKEDPIKAVTPTVYVWPTYKKGARIVAGYVDVFVPGKNLIRDYCSGSVRIANSYSAGKTADYSYDKPLKFVKNKKYHDGNGYCTATISTSVDKKRSEAQSVSITASLINTPYLTPASANQSITVPATSH